MSRESGGTGTILSYSELTTDNSKLQGLAAAIHKRGISKGGPWLDLRGGNGIRHEKFASIRSLAYTIRNYSAMNLTNVQFPMLNSHPMGASAQRCPSLRMSIGN